MEREIRFRAWHKGYKKMTPEFELGATKLFYLNSDHLTSSVQDSEVIHMQFTGLLDRHGKEICEGDIVKTDYGKIGDVVFHVARASYIIHDSDHFNEKLCDSPVTVIGNIYENPELIKTE